MPTTQHRFGGRQAMPENEKLARAARMRELRKAAGFVSQEALADAAGLERVEINRVETGRNVLSSADLRQSLTRALNVTEADLMRYLDGALTLADVLARRHARRDLSAQEFLARLDRVPGLRRWIESTQGSTVALAELAQAIEAIEAGRATPPANRTGWAQFFADLRARRAPRIVRG